MGDTKYYGGFHDARERYHEYRERVFSTMGDTILCNLGTVGDIKILNIPHGTHGTLHDIKHPTLFKISPTVVNIPHNTQDIPPHAS